MKRVFAHIGFSFAITLILLNFMSIEAALVILPVTGALFLSSVSIEKTRNAVSIPLCFMSSFLACILFVSVYYGTFVPQSRLDGKSAPTSFYLVSLDEKTVSGYSYTAKTTSVDLDGAPQNIKITIYTDEKIKAEPYQIIDSELKFRLVSDNGYDSYGSFGDGIFLSSRLYSYNISDGKSENPYKYILNLKNSVRELIRENTGEAQSGIVLALVCGDKSDLKTDVKSDFRASGVSHIMAVSGLHLSVLSGTLYWVLKKLRVPKIPNVILSITVVCFYMALTGFSKSIMRAGIMTLIFLIGILFDEKSDSLNSLGLAVFIICLNPYAVTDAGALLTVTAVLGLIAINPHLNKIYKPKNPLLKYIYGILTASLSVFVTTFPVLYFSFGYVSIIGTILNIVMIPAAQLTLITSFLMVIFQFLSPLLFIFSRISNAGAAVMLFFTQKCAVLPFAVRDISSPLTGMVISSIFFLFGITFIFKKRYMLRTAAIISCVLFAAAFSVSSVLDSNSVFVRTVSGYKTTAAVAYSSNCAVVIGVSEYSQYYTVKNLIMSGNIDNTVVIDYEGSKYASRLAEEIDAQFYINNGKIKQITEKDVNYFNADDFKVDLLPEFNVKYHYNKNCSETVVTAYNSEFEVLSSDSGFYGENTIFCNTSSEYDLFYNADKYGTGERRLNQWLK